MSAFNQGSFFLLFLLPFNQLSCGDGNRGRNSYKNLDDLNNMMNKSKGFIKQLTFKIIRRKFSKILIST